MQREPDKLTVALMVIGLIVTIVLANIIANAM